MNLLLAAVLLTAGFAIGLPSVIDEQLPSGARVRSSELTIMTVVDGSPAQIAGIQAGESIVSIDGQSFDQQADAARSYIAEHAQDGIVVQVAHEDGTVSDFTLTSAYLPEQDVTGIGVGMVQTGIVSLPWYLALLQGVVATATYTGEVVRSFGQLIGNLLTGQGLSMDVSGPVGIAVITGKVAAKGILYLLQFTALLSINLAVINILPFPALDGGRIFFLVIEKLRGRALKESWEIAAHNFGFLLLMVLVVLVTYRDFVQYGGEMLSAIRSLI